LVFITGSIARSASCRYLLYSEADFAPMGVKFGTDEGTEASSVPYFTPSVQQQGCMTQEIEIFTQI